VIQPTKPKETALVYKGQPQHIATHSTQSNFFLPTQMYRMIQNIFGLKFE